MSTKYIFFIAKYQKPSSLDKNQIKKLIWFFEFSAWYFTTETSVVSQTANTPTIIYM